MAPGDREGRFPHDRGFDEWYGISRTTNESLFTTAVGFDPAVVDIPCIQAGRRGEPVRRVADYDLEMRRRIDGDLTGMACDFIATHGKAGRRFFLYLPLDAIALPDPAAAAISKGEPAPVTSRIPWSRWIIASGRCWTR